MTEKAQELNSMCKCEEKCEWNAHKVEQAIWSHTIGGKNKGKRKSEDKEGAKKKRKRE